MLRFKGGRRVKREHLLSREIKIGTDSTNLQQGERCQGVRWQGALWSRKDAGPERAFSFFASRLEVRKQLHVGRLPAMGAVRWGERVRLQKKNKEKRPDHVAMTRQRAMDV